MSVRGLGDAYALQRLLWLLIGTVIVPTVLLSLYAGMAMRYQDAAILQQAQATRQLRLQQAAQTVFARIERIDAEVRRSASDCTSQPCALGLDGASEVWTWRGEPPAPLLRIGLPADVPGEQTLWFSPTDGSDPVGVTAHGAQTVAWRLDLARIQQHLKSELGRQAEPDGGRIRLLGSPPGPAPPVEELAARWREPAPAELLLDRPLGHLRLVLDHPAGDPVQEILGRTAWLYPLGLVCLVALILTGTVITLTSAGREIRLSRLQTDFVSSVSHELRTPLTAIRMFVETLQSGRLEDPERIQECLGLLAKESDRLSRMIERVLSWARMEAGRRVYEFEPVPTDELVADAISALRSQNLLEAEVDIAVDIEDGVPPARVDRDAIVEALLNLLQNAIKYTPPPRRIAVSVHAVGRRICMTVTDNGPGIARRDRKRIFEKFYQADTRLSADSFTGPERGSGLGLSIVRAVTRGHGGRVQLSSEIGRGSRFTLWLPAAAPTR